MLPLISCASKQTTVVIVPDLFFPSLPDPVDWIFLDAEGKEVTDNETEIKRINIPYSWLIQLVDFKLDYDETREYYFAIKKGYSAIVDGDNK